jgi:hypothetical protein
MPTGLMVTSRLGEQKPHPLLGIERDSRAAFLAGMRHLNLDYEPVAPTSRPQPPEPRGGGIHRDPTAKIGARTVERRDHEHRGALGSPWLEMWDLIDAGWANRGDLSQALFMRDLRPLHPEWSPTELRRWTDGGRWRHAIKFGRPFPYCERCGRHFDHRTRMSGHLCSTCDQGGENLPCR